MIIVKFGDKEKAVALRLPKAPIETESIIRTRKLELSQRALARLNRSSFSFHHKWKVPDSSLYDLSTSQGLGDSM